MFVHIYIKWDSGKKICSFCPSAVHVLRDAYKLNMYIYYFQSYFNFYRQLSFLDKRLDFHRFCTKPVAYGGMHNFNGSCGLYYTSNVEQIASCVFALSHFDPSKSKWIKCWSLNWRLPYLLQNWHILFLLCDKLVIDFNPMDIFKQ